MHHGLVLCFHSQDVPVITHNPFGDPSPLFHKAHWLKRICFMAIEIQSHVDSTHAWMLFVTQKMNSQMARGEFNDPPPKKDLDALEGSSRARRNARKAKKSQNWYAKSVGFEIASRRTSFIVHPSFDRSCHNSIIEKQPWCSSSEPNFNTTKLLSVNALELINQTNCWLGQDSLSWQSEHCC